MKSEGKDNDLISRVRANPYFAPIHDQLDGMIPLPPYFPTSNILSDILEPCFSLIPPQP